MNWNYLLLVFCLIDGSARKTSRTVAQHWELFHLQDEINGTSADTNRNHYSGNSFLPQAKSCLIKEVMFCGFQLAFPILILTLEAHPSVIYGHLASLLGWIKCKIQYPLAYHAKAIKVFKESSNRHNRRLLQVLITQLRYIKMTWNLQWLQNDSWKGTPIVRVRLIGVDI